MMASVDEIISTLETEFLTLDDKAKTVMRWGKAAGESADSAQLA